MNTFYLIKKFGFYISIKCLMIIFFISLNSCEETMDIGPVVQPPFFAVFEYMYPNPINQDDTLTIGVDIFKNDLPVYDTIDLPRSINDITVERISSGLSVSDTFEITYFYNPKTKEYYGNLKNDSIIQIIKINTYCFIIQTKVKRKNNNNKIGLISIILYNKYILNPDSHLIFY